MRIYKKLDEAMDDQIRVGDIIEYCRKAAKANDALARKCIKSTGKGESQTSALGGAAYFLQKAEMFTYEIPNLISCIINEPFQTEEDLEDD